MQLGSVSLTVSYMEIYKEEVYDLLVTRENVRLCSKFDVSLTVYFQAPKLPIREDSTGKIIVANLSDRPIASFQEFDRIYSPACKSRSTGATNLNHASSRSHAILAITVTTLDVAAQRGTSIHKGSDCATFLKPWSSSNREN